MKKSFTFTRSLLYTSITIMIIFSFNNLYAHVNSGFHDINFGNIGLNLYSEKQIPLCTTGTWIGTVSSEWNNPSNWCNGIVPGPTLDVIIASGGHQPIINALAECKNITINSGATLTILDANMLMVKGHWSNYGSFIANSSTVIFGGLIQSIIGTINSTNNFYNVIISGEGKKTNDAYFTVNGFLSIEGNSAATLSVAPKYGPNATLQYNTSAARTAGLEWPNSFSGSGGIIIDNIGTITLTSSIALENGIPLTINSGAILATASKNITLGGDLHNHGVFNLMNTEVIIGPGTATQQIDGFSTNGNISVSKSAGTATFMGNVSGGGIYTTGYGTLNLGDGLTHTFTGRWTRGYGTINCSTSTIRFGGDVYGSNGAFNTQDGTVEWFSSAPINIIGGNYNNLIISGTGIKTTSNYVYIKRMLTIESGAQLDQNSKIEKLSGINEAASLNIYGYLRVSETFPANFSIFNNEGGTIEYNSITTQNIDIFPYNNLILSGNTKIFKGSIQIYGNFTIKDGARCDLLSNNSSANTLTLGNYGQVPGVWGGNASNATIKNNYYFVRTSIGKLTVISDSSIPGLWIGKTNSDWGTASNWSDENVPTHLTNVIVTNNGFAPDIKNYAFCKNISILPVCTLTISASNTLNVKGDWVNEGVFIPNSGTVAFDGVNQAIGTGPYTNITIGGSGDKTVSNVLVNGILSIEGTASMLDHPFYGSNATLQYNCNQARFTGNEWPSTVNISAGVIIKNTGVVSLNSAKILNQTPITVLDGSTLDIGRFTLDGASAIYLQCGAQSAGSLITGSGYLKLAGNVNVVNCGKGEAPATIDCPIVVNNYSFNVLDGNPNAIDPIDLFVNSIVSGNFKKEGAGTMSLLGNASLTSLAISAGNFTLQPSGKVTLNGSFTNTVGAAGFTLLSDNTRTGSLIISSTTIGSGCVKRYMTSGAWHLVASPLAGETIQNFLGANTTIPTTVSASNLRAMREYLPADNVWGEFFTTGAGGTAGNLLIGKGYCMRVKNSTAHEVAFTGVIQTGDKTISGLSPGNWNCIGNPYTSAIGVTSTSGTANFLQVNAVTNGNIDPAFGIYIWDKTDAYNGQAAQYTAISNALNTENLHYLQQGQGFMVKMALGKTAVNFTKAMQAHNTSLTLKSTEDIWPTIKLKAAADSTASSTIIAFHEEMTDGLDVTYDAGLLKSGGSMELYTRLVDDYGIPFAIQALPSDRYDRLIVPVGIDYSKGGMVSFSAEGTYLPSSCRPILEDRLTGIFTDLSDKTYTAELTANTAGTDRFFLHTSYTTTMIKSTYHRTSFNARIIDKGKILIKGSVSTYAKATLFDIKGRNIASWQMAPGPDNIVEIPTIRSGMYLLYIQNNGITEVLKLANIF